MNKAYKFIAVLAIASITNLSVIYPRTVLAELGDFGSDIREVDGGYKAVVLDKDGNVIWTSDKTYGREGRAQRKADEKAQSLDIDGSFMDRGNGECDNPLIRC